jgi:hypothetical protein
MPNKKYKPNKTHKSNKKHKPKQVLDGKKEELQLIISPTTPPNAIDDSSSTQILNLDPNHTDPPSQTKCSPGSSPVFNMIENMRLSPVWLWPN